MADSFNAAGFPLPCAILPDSPPAGVAPLVSLSHTHSLSLSLTLSHSLSLFLTLTLTLIRTQSLSRYLPLIPSLPPSLSLSLTHSLACWLALTLTLSLSLPPTCPLALVCIGGS